MNIKDIYMGTVYTFEVIPTKVDDVVRLETSDRRFSILHKNNDEYLDLLSDKVVTNPEHRIIQTVIFANTNEVDENKEYVFSECLSSFKDYANLTKLSVKEEITKKELLQVIRNDEFLLKSLREEVKNEKSI